MASLFYFIHKKENLFLIFIHLQCIAYCKSNNNMLAPDLD